MKNYRQYALFLAVLIMSFICTMPAQAAAMSYAMLDNGDSTCSYFAVDPLLEDALDPSAEAWADTYSAVSDAVETLYPDLYEPRKSDLIILLYDRPISVDRAGEMVERLSHETEDGVEWASLSDVLEQSGKLFYDPAQTDKYWCRGMYWWLRNGEYDVIAVNYTDFEYPIVHELAHSFTSYWTTTEEREEIAFAISEYLGVEAI